MGVDHFRGVDEFTESSSKRERAAAVNDLVVDAVKYSVSGVALVSGNSAIPYPFLKRVSVEQPSYGSMAE